MAQIFASPFAQYTDASGNPGTGDKLYFYQTGTTTALTIYSDIGLGTPQANPVIADSAGQWPAVYLAEQTYKVVMKSAADVTIRTADPAGGDGTSGAASSTDNAAVRFDGTSGHKLQDSLVIIGDTGNVTGVAALTISGAFTGTSATLSGALSGTSGSFSGVLNADGSIPLTLTYSDNGIAFGPMIDLYRISTTPAASDQIGIIQFNAKNSSASKTLYANIYAVVDDPTNGGEDGILNFGVVTAGVMAQKTSLFGSGFAVSNASSGALIDPDGAVAGASLSSLGQMHNLVTNNVPLNLGRSNSGTLVNFHTSGSVAGAISEAAGTVTYGAFCGAHWSQFEDGERHEILPGTILETIDSMCKWLALSFTDHEGNDRVVESGVPAGAKAGDTVEYSYRREKTIQVEVNEEVFEEVEADDYQIKKGRAILVSRKRRVPVFDALPIIDDSGQAVLTTIVETDAKGKTTTRSEPKYLRVQRTRKVKRDKSVKVTEIVKATVVLLDNQTLPKIRISETVGSQSVYGVFSHWDDDDTLNNDLHSASLGAKFIRIAGSEVVHNGAMIESNGDGCGRVQADDIMRSSTVAKVTAAIAVQTYPDGSYLVPCTLHCG